MKYRAVAVVFALIAFSPSGTPADQQATRVCLFLPAANTEEVNTFRSIVIVELTREMEKRGFAIIPEQTWRAKLSQEELSSVGLLQSSAAVQLAERAEADIALIGSIQIEGRDIILRIRGYDVATGSLMFSGEKRGAKDIGIYNRFSSLSRELTDALLGWAESQPGTIALPQSETSVLEGELAARPPAFLSIVPDTVLAGKAQSLLVTVDNLSRDGSVSLVSPSGSVIPASVDRVSRTTLRIGLPALDQVGEYSLALTNPPDLTTTVGAALRVRYPSPTVTALEPDRFQSDHAPRTLRLRGGDFSPQATVSVNVDGTAWISPPFPARRETSSFLCQRFSSRVSIALQCETDPMETRLKRQSLRSRTRIRLLPGWNPTNSRLIEFLPHSVFWAAASRRR